MSRFVLPVLVCIAMAAQVALADDLLPSPPSSSPSPAQPPAQPSTPMAPSQAPSQQAVADARAACETDIQNLCASVQPGGGRILACLKQHKDQVSQVCKQAVAKATRGSN